MDSSWSPKLGDQCHPPPSPFMLYLTQMLRTFRTPCSVGHKAREGVDSRVVEEETEEKRTKF